MNEPSRVSDRPLVSHCRSLPFPRRSFVHSVLRLATLVASPHSLLPTVRRERWSGNTRGEDVTSGRKTDGSGHECSRYATPLAPFLRPSAHPRLRLGRRGAHEAKERRRVWDEPWRAGREARDMIGELHSFCYAARRSSLASLPTPRPVLMSVSRAHYVPPSFPPHGRDTEWRVERWDGGQGERTERQRPTWRDEERMRAENLGFILLLIAAGKVGEWKAKGQSREWTTSSRPIRLSLTHLMSFTTRASGSLHSVPSCRPDGRWEEEWRHDEPEDGERHEGARVPCVPPRYCRSLCSLP